MQWSVRWVSFFLPLAFFSCAQKKTEPPKDLSTHLKDSVKVYGDAVVFLRPDSLRYEELNMEPDNGAAEVDSDHGFAIQQTIDSVEKDPLYRGITITVTDSRFIHFSDCVGCSGWMDRDTVNYGYVMTGPGRKPMMLINTVHSGDYLQEIHAYFGIDSMYGFRKLSLSTMFNTTHLFTIKDTIFADFNGDGEADRAYFKVMGKKLALVIADKKGEVVVGAHGSFTKVGDDFSWASFWALTTDKALEEHLLKGAIRKHPLGPNSLVIQRDEVGGGVVTFKDGQYQWIHMTD